MFREGLGKMVSRTCTGLLVLMLIVVLFSPGTLALQGNAVSKDVEAGRKLERKCKRKKNCQNKPKVKKLKCKNKQGKKCSSLSGDHKCKKDNQCETGHFCSKAGNSKWGTCECRTPDCGCQVESDTAVKKIFGAHVNVQTCHYFDDAKQDYEVFKADSQGCGCKYPLFTMADGSCSENCTPKKLGLEPKVECPDNLVFVHQVHCQQIYNAEPIELCMSLYNPGCGCPKETLLDLDTMSCVCKNGTPVDDVNNPKCQPDM